MGLESTRAEGARGRPCEDSRGTMRLRSWRGCGGNERAVDEGNGSGGSGGEAGGEVGLEGGEAGGEGSVGGDVAAAMVARCRSMRVVRLTHVPSCRYRDARDTTCGAADVVLPTVPHSLLPGGGAVMIFALSMEACALSNAACALMSELSACAAPSDTREAMSATRAASAARLPSSRRASSICRRGERGSP